jgi:hypothetical protein
MSIFEYLFKKSRIVRSAGIGSAIQQTLVAVEILPREIRDVVSKFQIQSADSICRINETFGYKSTNDAIVNAQNVGLRFLKNVKPENLFFFFGETVESLRCAFSDFCNNHLIPYPTDDWYAPIYHEQSYKYNKSAPNILAVVLCKITNSDWFQKNVGAEQKNIDKVSEGEHVFNDTK